ncbi:hypothetical protein AB1Y20_012603 [Prymnesium parvum]|uniref:peptidylprolyl isomerase n=1 Tax=Prymnesium parvum TaxID=97485 RepID=A0AB34IL60_PRYPA
MSARVKQLIDELDELDDVATEAAQSNGVAPPTQTKLNPFSSVDMKAIQAEIDEIEAHEPKGQPDAFSRMRSAEATGSALPTPEALREEYEAGGGLGSITFEDWKARTMEKEDIGRTMACTADRRVLKRLLEAGSGFENPRAPWEVQFTYIGKVKGGGTFDTRHATEPLLAQVGAGSIEPIGLEKGILTMRRGEKAKLMVQPQLGFGALGFPTLGVPPDAELEFTVHLINIIEVSLIGRGKISKRKLRAGSSKTDVPQRHAEVRVRWSGVLLEEPDYRFQEEDELLFVAGDARLPQFWELAVVGQMRKGEIAELEIPSELAFGEEGDLDAGVPPAAPIRIVVELLDWEPIEDVSPGRDGSALKRVLVKGTGISCVQEKYECLLDLRILRADGLGPAKGEPLLERKDVTLSITAIPSELAEGVRAIACGVDALEGLKLLLKTMTKGEHAQLRYTHGGIVLDVSLRAWVVVCEVRGTSGQVVKKVEPGEVQRPHEWPAEDCAVRVHYSSWTVGGVTIEQRTEELVEFIVGSGSVLPAIDRAVLEMQAGSRCRLSSAPTWAYGAPSADALHVPPEDFEARFGQSAVEIDLTLVDFVAPRKIHELTTKEAVELQALKKGQGDALFKRGQYDLAVARYEKSNAAARHPYDVMHGPESQMEKEALKATIASVRLASYLNLAACHIKIGGKERAESALAAAEEALTIEAGHPKALYRRGQARTELGELDLARTDLIEAARKDPNNREIRGALELLKEKQAQLHANDVMMYGGMFQK